MTRDMSVSITGAEAPTPQDKVLRAAPTIEAARLQTACSTSKSMRPQLDDEELQQYVRRLSGLKVCLLQGA